jgi:hypothetical protein
MMKSGSKLVTLPVFHVKHLVSGEFFSAIEQHES